MRAYVWMYVCASAFVQEHAYLRLLWACELQASACTTKRHSVDDLQICTAVCMHLLATAFSCLCRISMSLFNWVCVATGKERNTWQHELYDNRKRSSKITLLVKEKNFQRWYIYMAWLAIFEVAHWPASVVKPAVVHNSNVLHSRVNDRQFLTRTLKQKIFTDQGETNTMYKKKVWIFRRCYTIHKQTWS